MGDRGRSTCQRLNRDGTLSQPVTWSLETQAVDWLQRITSSVECQVVDCIVMHPRETCPWLQAVDCRTRLLATKNHKEHKSKILSCELCAFWWLDSIGESWIALSCIHAELAHDCRRSIALLQWCLTGFVILTLETLTQNKRNDGMHTKQPIARFLLV
jgi:hypothetical protein